MTSEKPDNLQPENYSSEQEPELQPVDGQDIGKLLGHALDDAEFSSAKTLPNESTSSTTWEPPRPEDLSSLFPGFQINSLLGRGGMGAVYQATQTSLDREVAIKILPPELARSSEFSERFRREAKAMAKLNHPNIVQIYDFGETGEGHFYFVMEFVEGVDLHQYIRSGELKAEGALNAVSQICDALQYAHGKGFVHRDIKPANVFLNNDGNLKVGDFGLAKLISAGNPDDLSPAENAGLTMTGVAMGTPHYIAPEQLEEGAAVDHRADIYSLGILFYEMLTSELPRGAVKRPSQKIPQLDVRIDGVVYRAMEPNLDTRYQSAADVRSDVDEIRLGKSQCREKTSSEHGPNKSSVTRSHKARLFAASLILAIVAALGWWFMQQKNPSLPQTIAKKEIDPPIYADLDGESVPFYNKSRGGRDLPTTDKPTLATKDMPFENKLGMRFIPVPINGGPTHGKLVLFSIWETRLRDYEVFAANSRKKTPKQPFTQRSEDPVGNVSWNAARDFCEWLTHSVEGSTGDNSNLIYRLPTDHEWSNAVGIARREDANASPLEKHNAIANIFPWGSSFPPSQKVGNLYGTDLGYVYRSSQPITNYADGEIYPCEVGRFKSNQFGLYDLSGNTWEWCDDKLAENLDERVLRGGGYVSPKPHLASSYRSRYFPTWSFESGGFRVVLEVGPKHQQKTESVDLPILPLTQ